jgi:excisionase family DNA binding protein
MAESTRLYFDVPYVANILGVSPDTIRRRIKDGSIQARKMSNLTRIHRDEIDRLIAEGFRLPSSSPITQS